jgi:hypothetical protein
MPETGSYLILGLAMTFLIIAFFIASMVIRYRNLQKDIHLLEQLAEDE